MLIRGPDEVRRAYQNDAVASGYVDERFREPLGALLHARQTNALRRLLAEKCPGRVLEIAPGPARLTVETFRRLPDGLTVVELSPQMLDVGRRRIAAFPGAAVRWIRGDGFHLPITAAGFDLVYSFRFIRHFEAAHRMLLYGEIARVLRPGGLLVFDAVNAEVSRPIRALDPNSHKHYDALQSPEEIRDELEAAGFEGVSLLAVQRRYAMLRRIQILVAPRSRTLARLAMEAVDRFSGGAPLEWIVTCRRR